MRPTFTTSNRPFSNVLTASGLSNRFRMTSYIEPSELASPDSLTRNIERSPRHRPKQKAGRFRARPNQKQHLNLIRLQVKWLIQLELQSALGWHLHRLSSR